MKSKNYIYIIYLHNKGTMGHISQWAENEEKDTFLKWSFVVLITIPNLYAKYECLLGHNVNKDGKQGGDNSDMFCLNW